MNVLTAPFRLLGWPFRLYRRRIGVQLIASHVLVILLTALVVEVIAVIGLGLFLGILRTDNPTDFATASTAESAASLLAGHPLAAQLADGAASLDDAERRELEQLISGFVYDSPSPPDLSLSLSNPDAILVTDPRGIVAVSSDPNWAMPGMRSTEGASPLTDQLIDRAIELQGSPSGFGNLYVVDSSDGVTVATHPIVNGGRIEGVVAVRARGSIAPSIAELATRPDVIASVIAANLLIFGLILIPTLLISVPVGIWRGRAMSRRLARLSEAATAMAAGDRRARATIGGEDEIAQLGRRFNEMLDHLDRADRERKAFVANVSHDLRTPIAIIQGHVEQITGDAGAQATPELRDALGVIHQETTTLSRLIDDLFTIARLEETSLPMRPEPVDVGQIAGELAGAIHPVAWDQRRVSVRSVVASDLPPVMADPTRMRQILGNLLYNALRHTPEGGLVVVDGAVLDDQVEIRVSDTGIGMTDEERERVFERFYRVEQGQRAHDGAGLGMAIVKQLVEAQGGSVAVESTPGQGTTFSVRLPIAT